MSEQQQRPGKTRRRVVTGGILAGVVGLGIWLLSLLPGMGLGLGSGSGGEGSGKSAKSLKSAEQAAIKIKNPSPKTIASNVVHIQLDPDNSAHVLDDNGVKRAPIDVANIVELAKAAKGNEKGVRVLLKVFAKTTGLDSILAALKKAGLEKGRDVVIERVDQ